MHLHCINDTRCVIICLQNVIRALFDVKMYGMDMMHWPVKEKKKTMCQSGINQWTEVFVLKIWSLF